MHIKNRVVFYYLGFFLMLIALSFGSGFLMNKAKVKEENNISDLHAFSDRSDFESSEEVFDRMEQFKVKDYNDYRSEGQGYAAEKLYYSKPFRGHASHNHEVLSQKLEGILNNSHLTEKEKLDQIQLLLKPGTRATTFFLIDAILYADYLANETLRDGLLQLLAETDTLDSAAALIDILAGDVEAFADSAIPADVQAIMEKAIRMNPAYREVGQLLADRYIEEPSQANLDFINQIGHPESIAILASQSESIIPNASHIADLIPGIANVRAIDSLAIIGESQAIPAEELNEIAYSWGQKNLSDINQEYFEAQLSDYSLPPLQRSLAASVLGASPNQEQTVTILEKSYSFETDPGTLEQIVLSIDNLLHSSGADTNPLPVKSP